MAIRLSDYVMAGIVHNCGKYSTHGRLAVRGLKEILVFELTGYPSADLLDKSLEFEVPANDRQESPEDVRALDGLKTRQLGATGEMTACKSVRYGNPLKGQPTGLEEPCLFLEWFGPNGRVVVELPLSNVRILDEAEMARRRELEEQAWEEQKRQWESNTGTGLADPSYPPDLSLDDEPEWLSSDFGLVSDEFEREMEQQARQTDREAMPLDPEDEKAIRELELFDETLETGVETPVTPFLEGVEIPPTSTITSDAEAEKYLKPIIERMACLSIAFDVCDHCTPLKAYQILVDEILSDLGVHEPLLGGDFVLHVCAYEHCDLCKAEEERGEVPF